MPSLFIIHYLLLPVILESVGNKIKHNAIGGFQNFEVFNLFISSFLCVAFASKPLVKCVFLVTYLHSMLLLEENKRGEDLSF